MSAGADADFKIAFFRELHSGDDIVVSLRPHDDVRKAIRLASIRNCTEPRVLVAGIVAPEDATAHFLLDHDAAAPPSSVMNSRRLV